MSAGPFLWKQALLAPNIRVEVADATISVETARRRQDIPLADVSSIYLSLMRVPPLSHMLSTEVVAKNGEAARFGAQGYGMPSFESDQCTMASLAVLREVQAVKPTAEIYLGIRPTRQVKLGAAAAILAAFLYGAMMLWRQSWLGDGPGTLLSIAVAFAVVCSVVLFHLRDSKVARKISFDDAVALLA